MVTMKYFATTLIYVQYLWRIMISEINEDFSCHNQVKTGGRDYKTQIRGAYN